MTCDITGSGCKVCPGFWIAGILLLVVVIQSWFARPQVPSQTPSASMSEVSNLPDAKSFEQKKADRN